MQEIITIEECEKTLIIIGKCRAQSIQRYIMPPLDGFKSRRESLNLSMQDVKDKTGVGKATISRMERGSDVMHSTIVILNNFYNIQTQIS